MSCNYAVQPTNAGTTGVCCEGSYELTVMRRRFMKYAPPATRTAADAITIDHKVGAPPPAPVLGTPGLETIILVKIGRAHV